MSIPKDALSFLHKYMYVYSIQKERNSSDWRHVKTRTVFEIRILY